MTHPHLHSGFWARINGSLRARLFIPIAFFSTALTLTMVWAAVQIHGADMERASFERAMLFANLAAEGLSGHMLEEGKEDVEPLMFALRGHRPEIESVSLANSEGQVRFSSDKTLVGTTPWSVERVNPDRPVVPQGNSYAVLRPLTNEARCASCHGHESKVNGWLAVAFSDAPIVAAKRRLTSALLLAAIPSLLLLLGTTLWLVRREAIAPIGRLVKAMRRAQEGEQGVLADEGRTDEIGLAARNFDATMAALRRSREELEKTYELRMIVADRFAMVGQMASGLAHEIKNPLAGLSGALELLSEDLAHTPHKPMLSEMQHQVARLGKIMESLLSFARPRKAQLRSTQLNTAIEKVLFLVSQQRQASKITVRRELDPNLPRVHADPDQLEQVFLNICLNAYQAMDGKGGSLAIRTAREGDDVRIDFIDDGPGIAPEVRAHIFTPFFTTRPNGSGLGLSIVARLIAEHGGNVRCVCPPSGGTTFTVRLPAEPRERAAPRAPPSLEVSA